MRQPSGELPRCPRSTLHTLFCAPFYLASLFPWIGTMCSFGWLSHILYVEYTGRMTTKVFSDFWGFFWQMFETKGNYGALNLQLASEVKVAMGKLHAF